MIVDEGAARVNYPAIEIESEKSNYVSINLLVVQNFHLNSLHRHFGSTKKWPPAHAATLLAIYHRIEREWRSQSEDGIRDRTLVHLYSANDGEIVLGAGQSLVS